MLGKLFPKQTLEFHEKPIMYHHQQSINCNNNSDVNKIIIMPRKFGRMKYAIIAQINLRDSSKIPTELFKIFRPYCYISICDCFVHFCCIRRTVFVRVVMIVYWFVELLFNKIFCSVLVLLYLFCQIIFENYSSIVWKN